MPGSGKQSSSSGGGGGGQKQQTNLFAFFASNVPVPPKKRKAAKSSTGTETNPKKTKVAANAPIFGSKVRTVTELKSTTSSENESSPPQIDEKSTKAIVPRQVSPTPRNVMWQSIHDNHVLIRRPTNESPRSKVAAFDLDGTLLVWTSPSWPSDLSHYELWNPTVYRKLRKLHDDGYKLLFVSNQGAVQKAHSGKKATLVKTVMDWIAHGIQRPVHAVISTRSPKKAGEASFHKPSPKLWGVAKKFLNKNEPLDIASSFFVGDSADPNDEQGGVDAKFAQAVAETFGDDNDTGNQTLKFYTPPQYFGPSSSEQRKQERQVARSSETPTPPKALQARLALLGGYYQTTHTGPLLLVLCGVQGSGKSTFCKHVLEESKSDENPGWAVFSQDTIQNGKPGKREKVEEAAREALQNGRSVIVDRMHLDPLQRGYFVAVAQDLGVPAHTVVLSPPSEVIAQRVRERTNHPGKVQGEEGARRALQSIKQLQLPTYEEAFELITTAQTAEDAVRLAQLYRATTGKRAVPEVDMKQALLPSKGLTMPSIILGTMGIGKRIAEETLVMAFDAGITAIDTAPTYNNEEKIGDVLVNLDKEVFCVGKIPKSAINPDDVQTALQKTLEKLQRSHLDLLLLHWPSDVISAGTLTKVWKEMEECYYDGKCKALGVCNFNTNALAQLLSSCRVAPVINQVERHPLLPQMDLMDFCCRNGIKLQAHTPLGQGKDKLLDHEVVKTVSAETSLSSAQVVLRWNLQHGISVVAKSKSQQHLQELLETKPLKSDHMKQLDEISTEHRFVAPPFMYGMASYCWDERMPPRK